MLPISPQGLLEIDIEGGKTDRCVLLDKECMFEGIEIIIVVSDDAVLLKAGDNNAGITVYRGGERYDAFSVVTALQEERAVCIGGISISSAYLFALSSASPSSSSIDAPQSLFLMCAIS